VNPVSRLLRWLDSKVTARLDRELAVAPLLSGYSLDTNPRRYPCCAHCRAHWYPADCPVVHVTECPDCADGAA
jgi:hypothetical protein